MFETGAAAGRATPVAAIEAERARGVAALARKRRLREKLADRVERANVAGRIGPRCLADGRLVDHDHIGQLFRAQNTAEGAGRLGGLALDLEQARVEHILDQGGFARAGYPGDADETAQRDLDRDVAQVIAVDVGYGQLAWELRTDPRVVVLDRTNVRHLTIEQIGEPVDLIVADLSFISLTLVLPALVSVSRTAADFLVMVKPQFEVGRERLGAGGVVRDPQLRKSAVREVADAAYDMGLGCNGVVASSLPGPSGNVEYFLWLRRGSAEISEEALNRAIELGPQ